MKTLDYLTWQLQMGADEAFEDVPQNRLRASVKKAEAIQAGLPAAQAEAAQMVSTKAPAPAAGGIASAAAQKAKQLADSATTLDELREAVCSFDGLAICKTATKTVFADGNPKARIMLVGEAPGANEDIEGIPFCGASGKLLDNMLASIGLSRKENAYITNTIFWRPPGNRRPTPEELDICRPFVEKHIALMNPTLLVMVGGTAAAALVDDKINVSRLRGKVHSIQNGYSNSAYQTVVTFHPSYLLRSPQQKRLAWQDMLLIQSLLTA